MSASPSPLNWIYLAYTIAAAALTAINVRETVKQEGKDKFFVLSRIGTMILTVGTFFDNFRPPVCATVGMGFWARARVSPTPGLPGGPGDPKSTI